MANKEPRRIQDLGTLKALGHPLRMQLFRALQVVGTATASQLADQVGEAVSLVSYHLRKLAAHGLIEEAEGGGDARERWWRMAVEGVTVKDRDFRDAPEGVVAHSALSRLQVRQQSEMYEDYLDSRAAWEPAWRDAAFSSEHLLSLTPEELRLLGQELDALAARWSALARAAEEAGRTEGRENVAVHLYGFPFRT
ncbi:helix-turn-helix domain-containing protein [Nonomuraea pusilla]|uniref:helix-turn-helix domain-containing protein n=1 Tax=Nonomuraea pusilla TaxID=46177 RepID=UPI0033339558